MTVTVRPPFRDGNACCARAARERLVQVLGRLSHELRTPLNDVLGYAELIDARVLGPIEPAGYDDYVGNILISAQNILSILDGMTDAVMLDYVLQQQGGEMRPLIELSPDTTMVVRDGCIEYVNAAGLRLLGASAPGLVQGRPLIDIVHPASHFLLGDGLARLTATSVPSVARLMTVAGTPVQVEISAVSLSGEGPGGPVLLVARNVSELVAAMQAVTAREQRIRAIMDTVLDGILTLDTDGRVETCNAAAAAMLGAAVDDVPGWEMGDFLAEPHAIRPEQFLAPEAGRTGEDLGHEVWIRRRDGVLVPALLSLTETSHDGHRFFTATLRDLRAHKALAAKVDYLSTHDLLTELPNRHGVIARLDGILVGDGGAVAVLALDLEGFGAINDSLGHEAGNQVLIEVARRLRHGPEGPALVGRVGADEFVVVLRNVADTAGAIEAAACVQQRIAGSMAVADTSLTLSTAVGISVGPGHGGTGRELLRKAEVALGAVRKGASPLDGGLRAAYTPDMMVHSSERLTLERALHSALEDDQFHLLYQPQVDARGSSLIGCEALLRWEHPDLGTISPARFIPLAEASGLIIPIGEWVLNAVAGQVRAWLDQGRPPLRIGVNLSPRQFADRKLVDVVARTIGRHDVPPHLLDLEITESLLMRSADHTLALLREFKDLGVHMSVDDFGTGYSSLAYLKRFPVNTVKIDRAFVADLAEDPDTRAISSAIISLSHSLGLSVIAEGVETLAQAEILGDLGCDEYQGYLFGKPMSAADLESLHLNRRATS